MAFGQRQDEMIAVEKFHRRYFVKAWICKGKELRSFLFSFTERATRIEAAAPLRYSGFTGMNKVFSPRCTSRAMLRPRGAEPMRSRNWSTVSTR